MRTNSDVARSGVAAPLERTLLTWMEEMRLMVYPGEACLGQCQWTAYFDALDQDEGELLWGGNLGVGQKEHLGLNSYMVYLPESYVVGRLLGRSSLIDFIPEGAKGNPPQDLILFQKSGD